jgi:IS30 family transposase
LRLYRRAHPDGNPRQLTSEAPGTPYGLAETVGDISGVPAGRLLDALAPLIRSSYPDGTARLVDLERLAGAAATASSLDQFLAELALDPPLSSADYAGPPGLDEDYLVLSTIHSAKGLEWEHVHLIHATDGNIPSDMALSTQEGVEEERRLSLRDAVAAKLREEWSPQQISGWLKLAYPEDETMRVSHETIYVTLFVQARGALKRELAAHLRRSRSIRRPRTAKRGNVGQGQIVDAVSIRGRPPEAEDRAIPGHWEGDLLSGAGNSHIATLVERHSRFVILIAVDGKDTRTVTDALSTAVRRLPEQLRRSLTWDRGTEMADHARFTVATNVHVYFCDPQSPWQRGSNENTNGLLRQYLPKGTNLANYSQPQLDEIARKLNTRPRETLGFRTPVDTLAAALR